ncbi:MAG: hypothetical protein HOG51_06615 [Gammaproteobacteria bacterium]|nr:hypothetical protein [Gammaproteobacteria bacterium]
MNNDRIKQITGLSYKSCAILFANHTPLSSCDGFIEWQFGFDSLMNAPLGL